MSHPEVKKYGLRDRDIAAIQNVFKLYPKINKVILYGSRAKGNYRAESDIDLTLQGDELVYADLVAIDNKLDDLLLPYTIDLSIYHLKEQMPEVQGCLPGKRQYTRFSDDLLEGYLRTEENAGFGTGTSFAVERIQ